MTALCQTVPGAQHYWQSNIKNPVEVCPHGLPLGAAFWFAGLREKQSFGHCRFLQGDHVIDALKSDFQSYLLGDLDQSLCLEIPTMKFEMFVGTVQHFLEVKAGDACIMRALPPRLVQIEEDFRVQVCIVDGIFLINIEFAAR